MFPLKNTLTLLLSTWIGGYAWVHRTSDLTPSQTVTSVHPSLPDKEPTGKQLAVQYCSGCHLFPDPQLLDKKTWVTSVLPNMGLRLGIHSAGQSAYADLPAVEEQAMRAIKLYPDQPLISKSEWDKIVAYYEASAPEKPLPQKPVVPATDSLPQFSARQVTFDNAQQSSITMIKYDRQTGLLFAGDAQNTVYALDPNLRLYDHWVIDSPPVDIDFPAGKAPRVLSIGVFSPSEQKLGRLMSLEKTASPDAVNIQSLPRPVQFAAGDLNMDGKEDVVICGFGNHTGKLVWLDNFDTAKEHILKSLPGARRVQIADLNGDQKPDIVALMAQAREEISVFYNQGDGNFKEKVALQFPPVYGMSYFELVDFNQDGHLDILATNGDNWDLSAIEKNYHGVRLFLNDGKDNFKEAWFYPLYGAAKAVAVDFDQDGDMDIAAIAFYNDLENPASSFVYLSNEGQMHFKTYNTPAAANGKWMTLEAADIDRDGDTDLVLGSYFHNIDEMTKLVARGATSFPTLLVLRNRLKGRK